MKIERNQLLAELQTVEGGVASKETVAQSKCFVFQGGEVMTYNDEVACRTRSSLSITAAVNASKMLNMVIKWPEETIEFKKSKGRLQFKGKAKRGYFKTEDDITLPIADIEAPTKCKKLTKELVDAIRQVQSCASQKGKDAPHLSCVHFTPKWVEACDGVQAGRFHIDTPFSKSVLLRREAVGQMVKLDVSGVGETKNWVHFKNKSGLTISCHKYSEEFPTDRLTSIFKAKGSPGILPKGLKELVDRLKVFLDDDITPWLKVKITSKYMEITGEGTQGSQSERKKIKYKGKPIGFSIDPQLLRDLTDRHDECEISDKVIKVKKGNFEYVTSLWIPNEKEEDEE